MISIERIVIPESEYFGLPYGHGTYTPAEYVERSRTMKTTQETYEVSYSIGRANSSFLIVGVSALHSLHISTFDNITRIAMSTNWIIGAIEEDFSYVYFKDEIPDINFLVEEVSSQLVHFEVYKLHTEAISKQVRKLLMLHFTIHGFDSPQ